MAEHLARVHRFQLGNRRGDCANWIVFVPAGAYSWVVNLSAVGVNQQGIDYKWLPTIVFTGLICLTVQHSPAFDFTTFKVLHSFPTNSYPQCKLVFGEDGQMYGTTQMGGDFGYGSIFRITTDGLFQSLFSFGRTNGAYPYSGLVKAGDGNLYGTAQNHGPGGYGVVFRLDTSNQFHVLHSFNGADGSFPKGVLCLATNGYLYGTTLRGGTAGRGSVFRISVTGAFETVASLSAVDGKEIFAGVTEGADGAFYGCTRHGGIFDGFNVYGTIFRVTAAGELKTIYYWDRYGYPTHELLQMENGLLYGTDGDGAISVTTNGTVRDIGYTPGVPLNARSPLVLGFDGALYGTSVFHVYRMTTNGVRMQLHAFYNDWNGADPRAALLQGEGSTLYGTTAQGGAKGGGIVFSVTFNTLFYPPTADPDGVHLIFYGLAGNHYRILRATEPQGPWQSAATVMADAYGVGRWLDPSKESRGFYRLVYP